MAMGDSPAPSVSPLNPGGTRLLQTRAGDAALIVLAAELDTPGASKNQRLAQQLGEAWSTEHDAPLLLPAAVDAYSQVGFYVNQQYELVAFDTHAMLGLAARERRRIEPLAAMQLQKHAYGSKVDAAVSRCRERLSVIPRTACAMFMNRDGGLEFIVYSAGTLRRVEQARNLCDDTDMVVASDMYISVDASTKRGSGLTALVRTVALLQQRSQDEILVRTHSFVVSADHQDGDASQSEQPKAPAAPSVRVSVLGDREQLPLKASYDALKVMDVFICGHDAPRLVITWDDWRIETYGAFEMGGTSPSGSYELCFSRMLASEPRDATESPHGSAKKKKTKGQNGRRVLSSLSPPLRAVALTGSYFAVHASQALSVWDTLYGVCHVVMKGLPLGTEGLSVIDNLTGGGAAIVAAAISGPQEDSRAHCSVFDVELEQLSLRLAEQNVNLALEHGITEPSTSCYQSPVLGSYPIMDKAMVSLADGGGLSAYANALTTSQSAEDKVFVQLRNELASPTVEAVRELLGPYLRTRQSDSVSVPSERIAAIAAARCLHALDAGKLEFTSLLIDVVNTGRISAGSLQVPLMALGFSGSILRPLLKEQMISGRQSESAAALSAMLNHLRDISETDIVQALYAVLSVMSAGADDKEQRAHYSTMMYSILRAGHDEAEMVAALQKLSFVSVERFLEWLEAEIRALLQGHGNGKPLRKRIPPPSLDQIYFGRNLIPTRAESRGKSLQLCLTWLSYLCGSHFSSLVLSSASCRKTLESIEANLRGAAESLARCARLRGTLTQAILFTSPSASGSRGSAAKQNKDGAGTSLALAQSPLYSVSTIDL
ncbi:hypothetical protein FVE85_4464 [Porphyridium purpureum]|uniref:Uncharacterized protein n=1 Tax=Porphyridium purpureum TaxID=35688 RepID=A0A5J4YKQ0_PORPP|nr:hypothetical protein FVE85_4464 [Porphyridium purpureum]|eukprot:POR7220..scf297_16